MKTDVITIPFFFKTHGTFSKKKTHTKKKKKKTHTKKKHTHTHKKNKTKTHTHKKNKTKNKQTKKQNKKTRFLETFSKRLKSFGSTCTLYLLDARFNQYHSMYMYSCKGFYCVNFSSNRSIRSTGQETFAESPNRSQTLGMLRAGQSTRQVAAVFGVAQSTISRLLQRFNATNSVDDRRATTRHQDNRLRNLTPRNRRITAPLQGELRTATGVNVSDQTIRNRLRACR